LNQYKPSSLSQIRAEAGSQASKGGTRDAHGLGRDKDGLVAKRGNARDFLTPTTHLLRVLVFDVRIGAGHDADRCSLGLGSETCRVCLRLSFDARALGDGFGSCDGGVCFRIGFRVAGFGLDAGDGEDTLLHLDLVAVFPIDISSLNLGL